MSRVSFCAEVAPIGTNHAYRPARWGKRHGFVKTDEARAYQEKLRLAAVFALGQLPSPARPAGLVGTLRAHLAFYWPSERGDADSAVKLTLDAMQGVLFENDRQVKELHILRLTDKARPRVMIEVEELAPGAANAVQPKPSPAPERKTAGRRLMKSNASKRLVASVRSFRGEGT